MSTLNFDNFNIEITVSEVDRRNVQIIAFIGKINHQNAYHISRDIDQLFENKIYNVILDLSELKYINSVGLAVILTMVKKVNQNSGFFIIGGVNQLIETIIQLVELPEKVQICQSVAEAKEFFAKS